MEFGKRRGRVTNDHHDVGHRGTGIRARHDASKSMRTGRNRALLPMKQGQGREQSRTKNDHQKPAHEPPDTDAQDRFADSSKSHPCLVYITLIMRRWLEGFPEGNPCIRRGEMRTILVILAACAVLTACPEKRVEAALADSGLEPDAGIDAGVIDAGPTAPASLEITVAAVTRDGGVTELKANAETEPASSIQVTLPIKLKDFRIRLLDWRDQLVVSDDELDPSGRTLTIALPEPLKTGRSYRLILDAELGPVVTDEAGAIFNDWEMPFRVAGEVVPEAPVKALKKKKK